MRTYADRPLSPPRARAFPVRLGLLVATPFVGALAVILVGIVGADAVYTDRMPSTCQAMRASLSSNLLLNAAEVVRRPAVRALQDFADRCAATDPDAVTFAALLMLPADPAPVGSIPPRVTVEPAAPASIVATLPPPEPIDVAPLPRPRPIMLVSLGQPVVTTPMPSPLRVSPPDDKPAAFSPAPKVVLYMGLGGNLFADNLKHLGEQFRRCGADVTIREWFMPSDRRYDVALGHSAGTSTLDRTNAPIKIALDPTIRFSPQRPVSRSYYTDGMGIRVPNTKNIYVPHAGHVQIPRVVEADIINYVFAGRCRVAPAETDEARARNLPPPDRT